MRDDAPAPAAGQTAPAAPAKRPRDTRLDFFRGLCMFIILIAHTPWNPWKSWIPARFGWSDATEIFVFCSGAAAAIAFHKAFVIKGFLVGSARVAYRVWQIYWCHVGIFLAIAAAMMVADWTLQNERSYVGQLNLWPFFNNPAEQLVGLLTLTYVPNYFDILVMYMVVLALMPVVVALARVRPAAALLFCVLLWAVASEPWLMITDGERLTWLHLPAEPWSDRTWFFNPFAWQLVFFTGFAFAVGWLPRPPVTPWLIALSAAVVIITIPFDWLPIWRNWDTAKAVREEIAPLTSKTHFGFIRYVHFLALAYLAWVIAGENGRRIPSSGVAGGVATVIRRVGQQSLAVFIAGLLLSRLMGIYINEMGRGDAWVIATANLGGFALLIGVAYFARFFRRQPWKI